MSLDQEQASNSTLQSTNDSAIHSFQPFESLPDEVLLLLLDQLTPFQRCLALSICRKWNETILQRKSWWQYLDIPDHLPFLTALSILQTFNSRSNFTLKHVILQPLLTSVEELDEVFAELEKSSGHVKLLLLNQSGFMLDARRAAQQLLPKLNTFYCTHSSNVKQALEPMFRERDVAEISDEQEKGLQFLHIGWLEQLDTDDLKWFSKLKHLSVQRTDSVKDLRHILEVSKGTLRRVRLDFWTFDRNLEGPDLVHADGFRKIKLPDLEYIFTPSNEASAAALGSLIDFEGQESTLFIGSIHPLLQFDFPSLRQVRIRMYGQDLRDLGLDEEEAKKKTLLFFEGNPSISHLDLDLDRVAGLQDGGSLHLDFILHSLSTKEDSGSSDESKRESQSFLLPKLQQLTIDTPYALNKKLLKQVWETWKVIRKNFKILVYAEGKVFMIDRSGGEEWLDEVDNCEQS